MDGCEQAETGEGGHSKWGYRRAESSVAGHMWLSMTGQRLGPDGRFCMARLRKQPLP